MFNRLTFCSFIISIVCFHFSCSPAKEKQKQKISSNPFIADSITYEFLNAVLNEEFENYNFSCKNVLENGLSGTKLLQSDSVKLVAMDSVFTPKDVAFIYKQVAVSDSFKLKPDFIRGRNFIPWDSIASIRRKNQDLITGFKLKYGNDGFCFIGMPLFSFDKSVAILMKGMVCGRHCGEEEVLIYQKKNNKWVEIFTLQESPEI